MPIEGKALDDQVFAAIEHFSENKEYNGVDHLLLCADGEPGKK